MGEEDGTIELIPRTHIISGSLVMALDGQKYYVGPFDGNRVKKVTLVPFLNQNYNDLGGPNAMLDFSRIIHIPIEVFLGNYTIILSEEGTAYPN